MQLLVPVVLIRAQVAVAVTVVAVMAEVAVRVEDTPVVEEAVPVADVPAAEVQARADKPFYG